MSIDPITLNFEFSVHHYSFVVFFVSDRAQSFVFDFSRTKTVRIRRKSFVLFAYEKKCGSLIPNCGKLGTPHTKKK